MWKVNLEQACAPYGVSESRNINTDRIGLMSDVELRQELGQVCFDVVNMWCTSVGDVIEFTSPIMLYHLKVERV
jgi:hypothetical protein